MSISVVTTESTEQTAATRRNRLSFIVLLLYGQYGCYRIGFTVPDPHFPERVDRQPGLEFRQPHPVRRRGLVDDIHREVRGHGRAGPDGHRTAHPAVVAGGWRTRRRA